MNKLAKYTERSKGLAKYDPKKGMKKIAFLEMVEKHYAKAKDAGQLTAAIRAKLEAQAEFVLWWDTQVEKQDGRPSDKRRGSATLIAGRDGLPDRSSIHRWRVKLNDPDKFEKTYMDICAKYPKLLEFDQTAHVSQNSGENEWYTPAEYIEAARRVMNDGIDLDPATSVAANKVVQAARIFTVEENGLKQNWAGRVWLNPPYAQPLIDEYATKLVAHVRADDLEAAVVLVNNATETQWFQKMAAVADAICFKSGRIRFWGPNREEGTPLQGQAFLYFGAEIDRFIREFRAFGFVLVVPE
jgi:phage N-6-adenine-methyltransferase